VVCWFFCWCPYTRHKKVDRKLQSPKYEQTSHKQAEQHVLVMRGSILVQPLIDANVTYWPQPNTLGNFLSKFDHKANRGLRSKFEKRIDARDGPWPTRKNQRGSCLDPSHVGWRLNKSVKHTATHAATHTETHTATHTATRTSHVGWWLTDCSVLLCSAVCYCFLHTVQHAATRCNTLQHTATHCNTLTM